MRAQFVLSEIGIGLRRNLSMTVAVVVTVAVSLVFLGAALLLNKQVDVLKGYWYDKIEVSLFLCNEGDRQLSCGGLAASPEQREQVAADLRGLPQVKEVYFENRDEAYARFREEFAGRAIADSVTASAMPESFRVKLHDPEQFPVVAATFAGRAGVESVQDERRVLDQLFGLLNRLRLSALLIALVNVVAATLMIMNTIRLTAFSRRRETGIMKLVGASNVSIQLPFVLEGALAGLAGALLACGGITAAYQFFVADGWAESSPLGRFITWSHVWSTLPWLVLAGVGLSAAASLLTLQRYLRV